MISLIFIFMCMLSIFLCFLHYFYNFNVASVNVVGYIVFCCLNIPLICLISLRETSHIAYFFFSKLLFFTVAHKTYLSVNDPGRVG